MKKTNLFSIQSTISKRIILSAALFLAVCTGTVFANEGDVTNPQLEKILHREFSGAQHIKWNESGDYYNATFVLGGHRTIAWFSKEGELLGSARDMFYNQLPLVVMRALDKKFKPVDIVELREITNAEGTRYKGIFEEKGKKYSVLVSAEGAILDTACVGK
jgi:hypothetical protein